MVKYIRIIIIVMILILSFFWIKSEIKSHKANHSKKVSKTESSAKAKVTTLPDMYTEYYTLKKSKVIRVNIPSGYTSSCSSGGKKYYKQPQNGKKEIRGDGGNYRDKYVSYFDLSFYEEEIVIVVEFKKQ